LSDVSQGPGWWHASDGNFYPPESRPGVASPPYQQPQGYQQPYGYPPQGQPPKRKSGVARGCLVAAGVVVLLIVVLAIVGALVGTDKKKTTTAKPSGGSSTETTGASVNYPGKQDEDHVASAGGEVRLSGFTVTVPTWEKKAEEFRGNLICGTVRLLNRDDRAQRYSEFDWRLQSPNGDVKDATIATENSLGTGDLVPNGTNQGRVCFQDPGVPGQYIPNWKPDVFNAARGIWLFNL
jgi:hypothetical protein